jgi:hypothetical protein
MKNKTEQNNNNNNNKKKKQQQNATKVTFLNSISQSSFDSFTS